MQAQIEMLFDNALQLIASKSFKKTPELRDFTCFRRICDPMLARHTCGIFRIDNEVSGEKKLIVYVDSGQAAQEFKMNTALYLARTKIYFNETWINSIEFKVSRKKPNEAFVKLAQELNQPLQKHIFSSENKSEEQIKNQEISEEEYKEACNLAHEITDQKLRDQVVQAYLANKRMRSLHDNNFKPQ